MTYRWLVFVLLLPLPLYGQSAKTARVPAPEVSRPAAILAEGHTTPRLMLAPAPSLASTKNPARLAYQPAATMPVLSSRNRPAVATRIASLPSSNNDTARLDALEQQLNTAEQQLNAAGEALSQGQRELQDVNHTLQNAMMEAGPDSRGLHPFVRVASRYAGTPYVWGGESGRGFDCSGFIIRVMRDLGYRALPHSAAEQFQFGQPVAEPLLKPGDLVFFANTYKAGISHVGIYLGHRRFIHAAGTRSGTIVSSLDDAHYHAKYAGARRLIRAQQAS